MNSAQWLQLIALLVGSGGVSSGLMALILLRQRKKKLEAETDRLAVTVLNTVISALTEENKRLKSKAAAAEAEIDDLLAAIKRLKVKAEAAEAEIDELRAIIKSIGAHSAVTPAGESATNDRK